MSRSSVDDLRAAGSSPEEDRRPPHHRPAKEALFNILRSQIDLEETEVLDLFAASARFPWSSSPAHALCAFGGGQSKAIDFIRSFADAIDAEGPELVCGKAESFLERNFRKFDLVFADPPYDYGAYEALVDQIQGGRFGTRIPCWWSSMEKRRISAVWRMANIQDLRAGDLQLFDPPERQ